MTCTHHACKAASMTLEALGASVVALSILVFSVSGYHQFPTSVQFIKKKTISQ